jgi:hypothetical protein
MPAWSRNPDRVDADHLEPAAFQQPSNPELREAPVVVRHSVQAANERYAENEVPAGLQDALDLCDHGVGIRNVFEDLIRQDGIEALVFEWKFVGITDEVHFRTSPVVDADVLLVTEEIPIPLLATTQIQNSARDMVRGLGQFVSDDSFGKPPGLEE